MTKETANVQEYKIDNNAKIANFVCLWKTRVKTSNDFFVFAIFTWKYLSIKNTFVLVLNKVRSEGGDSSLELFDERQFHHVRG